MTRRGYKGLLLPRGYTWLLLLHRNVAGTYFIYAEHPPPRSGALEKKGPKIMSSHLIF